MINFALLLLVNSVFRCARAERVNGRAVIFSQPRFQGPQVAIISKSNTFQQNSFIFCILNEKGDMVFSLL